MPEQDYRHVTVADDGTVLGERGRPGGGFVRFEASLGLLWIEWACEAGEEAAAEIWSLQDGYGPAGYTPVQGWDWSGIRDSSPAAVLAMLDAARRHLPDPQVAHRLGVDVGTLRRVLALSYPPP